MIAIRIIAGIVLFAVSAMASAYVSDVLGLDDGLAYMAVGGILAFLGGMVFHSGLITRRCLNAYR